MLTSLSHITNWYVSQRWLYVDLFKEHTNVVFVPRLSCTLGCVTDLLCHLMFEDIVHLLKVIEDVCDLLVDHSSPSLCSVF